MAKFKQGFYEPVYKEKYIQPFDRTMNKGQWPEYRSSWELLFFKFCDANPAIARWTAEPFAIYYISPKDNRQHRYFIDGYIEWNNGLKYLVEIKPFKECHPPKPPKSQTPRTQMRFQKAYETYLVNQAKWDAARDFCGKKGLKFIVLTEKELGV